MDIWFPIRPARDVPLENRVASVFVHVADLRRSAEWYCRLLGLPVLEERLNGGPVYWFDLPGTHLILDSDAANRQNPDWRETMMPRLMFPAADIDRAYDYVREKGKPFFEPERHGPMAYFNFPDPEGNALMACWSTNRGDDPEPDGASPIRPRIGGVFVDVRDMRAAARWYTDLLGLPLDEMNAEKSVYSVPVTGGAALLLDRNRFLKEEPYSVPFFFETEDLRASLAYAREQGLETAGEPEAFPDLDLFVLTDPDGNRVMVCQVH
ncbi:VOC family protein [Cohnella caldifontis]|uniref:VOC family protein n=1 Tax=Cohnella caldifontis TaxID=3027471 RepID=UPI0023ED64A1|nr:VOC family protein [Cohnella sp. YIM B05605]